MNNFDTENSKDPSHSEINGTDRIFNLENSQDTDFQDGSSERPKEFDIIRDDDLTAQNNNFENLINVDDQPSKDCEPQECTVEDDQNFFKLKKKALKKVTEHKKKTNEKICKIKKENQKSPKIANQMRTIFSKFKWGIKEEIGATSNKNPHHCDTRIDTLHYLSDLFENMAVGNPGPAQLHLPLFQEFDKSLGLSKCGLLQMDHSGELAFDKIKAHLLQRKSQCSKNFRNISHDIIMSIAFLQKRSGPNSLPRLRRKDSSHPREEKDFDLLYSMAAFTVLVLNATPSKKWAARLKDFDKSEWLRNKLKTYLQTYMLDEKVDFKIKACEKLMELLGFKCADSMEERGYLFNKIMQ